MAKLAAGFAWGMRRQRSRRTSIWSVVQQASAAPEPPAPPLGSSPKGSPLRRNSLDTAKQLVKKSSKRLLKHMAGAASQANRFPGSPDMSPEGIDRLVIMPDNRLKNMFDILIACCVMFTTVVMPLKCAPAPRLPHHSHPPPTRRRAPAG